jgi:D-glycero-D-manno-heptose 1,7-bisphosphate phosphatase
MPDKAAARGAVLLDKDGTLLENLPYNVDPARMRLAPGVAAALQRLGRSGRPLVVISNQPGVAFGYFPQSALGAVRRRLAELFVQQGATLAGFFYCPHHPAGTVAHYAGACSCRKPGSGLLRRAAQQLNLSLPQSWMVGDILDDIEAGRNAGCRTVLVDCGNESEWLRTPSRTPDYIVDDLDAAARIIEPDVSLQRIGAMPEWGAMWR